MTGCGKHGKTMKLFSHPPTTLGNRCGDSHITTATTTTGISLRTGQTKTRRMMHNITTQVGQIKWSKWAKPE